tara:strand:+ start:136 stop:513 length:378 start_codon:yes stop_codon:yes gene_type:complete
MDQARKYKVYLAKLKREDVRPRCVYKVGITSFWDAMERLNYVGEDESYPISNYFSDIKIMHSTRRKYTEDEAKEIEKKIHAAIKKPDDRWFHNWYEKDQISGITEMRVWDYDEFKQCWQLIEEHK